jgi:hypothetical protein
MKSFLFVVLVILLVTGLASAQNLVIGADASFSGNGVINVKGNIDNSAKTSAATIGGTVNLTGTSAQTIGDGGTADLNFTTLKATGVSTKTFNVNSTVSTLLDVAAGTSTKFDLNGKKLTLQDGISNTGSATVPFAFNASGSEVDYAKSSGAQSVFGTNYHTLTISGGSGTRTAGGAVTVASALTNNAGTILDFSAFAATLTGATINNPSDATLKAAGDVSITAGTEIGGTFEYYASTGSQSIGLAEYTNLTLSSGSGTNGLKQFANGITSVSGTYTLAGANRDYATNTSTFRYNGTNQTLKGDGYYNLTMLGSASDVKTADGNVSVANAFTNTTGITDLVAFNFSVAGTKTNSGTMRFAGETNGVFFSDGVVIYNGTSAQAAAGQTIALSGPSSSYNDLQFTNNAAKMITGGFVRTASGLTIGSGVPVDVASGATLSVINGDLMNNGDVTNAGTITVGE